VQAPPPALPSAVATARRQGSRAAAPEPAPTAVTASPVPAASPAPAALAAPAAAGATAKRQGAQPQQQLANAGAIAPAVDR
ncbi:type II and III secretion system protein family protein, partial [Burkholderia thailandensis]|nr:type II and III secretion system protein family protein [Burkholderia thailandensis]